MPARHRFHGDPDRFAAVAEFIADRFDHCRYVADVAGGQGMLSRLLSKHYGFVSEVIDPRGWTLRGVCARQEEFTAELSEYYDLVVGLHPDEALREVVVAATTKPVFVVPCCNFWSRKEKLGRDALIDAIREHHAKAGGVSETVSLTFRGPYNRGLVLLPR